MLYHLVCKSKLARHNFRTLQENHAAVQIQKLIRGWFARKKYKTQREFIIHIQSLVRRNICRKNLLGLRAEARSVNHFKEVSYALENKVVELTQTVRTVQNEKKAIHDRALQLEAQIKTWTEKYEKMERKAKNFEQELQKPTIPKETYDKLQTDLNTAHHDLRQSQDKVKSQDREMTALRSQLETERTEKADLKKTLEEAEEKAKYATDETEVADLRNQIVALKQQLSQALHTSRHRPANTLRNLSPAPGMRNVSPSPSISLDPGTVSRHRSRSPAVYPSTSTQSIGSVMENHAPRRSRRNSSSDKVKKNIEVVPHAVETSPKPEKTPRPVSISHPGALDIHSANVSEEVLAVICNEDVLQEEVLQGLIRSAKMPLPTLQNPPTRREIMFPAHTIAICVNEMWRLGYIQESERLLFNVMDSIQKQFLVIDGYYYSHFIYN